MASIPATDSPSTTTNTPDDPRHRLTGPVWIVHTAVDTTVEWVVWARDYTRYTRTGINQHPWLTAGLLFGVAVLTAAAIAFTTGTAGGL